MVPTIYLASQSPRRRDLFFKCGIPVEVVPNELAIESLDITVSIRDGVKKLALQKAEVSRHRYNGLVIGADTVVVLNDKVFGKPADSADAYAMISSLQGRWHTVISAAAIIDTANSRSFVRSATARVKVRSMTNRERLEYVRHSDIYDKAGAYGIQDVGHNIVDEYEGAYDTILGLPLNGVLGILKNYGIVKKKIDLGL